MRNLCARRPLRVIPALLVVAGLLAGSGIAAATPAVFTEYVALGDSWSADSTPMPTMISIRDVPFGCMQSVGNYPKQVAAALGVRTFRDASCGSATTNELTAPQSVLGWGVNPPQFGRLTRSTDLVTLGIGGNDAGLAGAVASCINLLPPLGLPLPGVLGNPCKPRWVVGGVDQMSVQIAKAEPKIAAAVDGIRARSPRATILLVDYLQGVPEAGCWPFVPILNDDVPWLRAKLEEFNVMLRRVADAKSVRFVDTYSTSAGHDFCHLPGATWMEGVLPLSATPLGLAAPFHPNQLGADHQAARVLDTVRGNR